MIKIVRVRALIQLLAIGIFIFQFQNSIWKYFSKPVIQQTSTTNLNNIKKPVIYVCQDNQFNYLKAKSYGYEWLAGFASGDVKDSGKISWKSKYDNLTFKELQVK